MKDMRIYNYEKYENVQFMKSRFLSQTCMEFSNSIFVAQKCMEFSNSRFLSVVVVLRPSSVPSVRRRRPSSSSSVRPSVVRRRPLPANPRPHANFQKERRNIGREYEILIELEIWKSIAGGKLLCVLKKLVLRPKHFCFRSLVPMSILTFWILYKMMIKYNIDKRMIILIKE